MFFLVVVLLVKKCGFFDFFFSKVTARRYPPDQRGGPQMPDRAKKDKEKKDKEKRSKHKHKKDKTDKDSKRSKHKHKHKGRSSHKDKVLRLVLFSPKQILFLSYLHACQQLAMGKGLPFRDTLYLCMQRHMDKQQEAERKN